MAIHDYVIDNQSATAFRGDLNSVLQAIVSQNSSATAPTTLYANMIWYDTATNQLKKRNEANSAWITLGTIDEGLGTFTPSGTPAIASQIEAEAGTENTKMMTALRSAQAIAALGGMSGINVQRFSASGTYTPTATYRYALCIVVGAGGGGGGSGPSTGRFSGGAGATVVGVLNLSGLAAQTVTIGTGGYTVSGLANNDGTAGGTTSIGSLITAGGGAGGTTTSGTSSVTGTGGVVLAAPNAIGPGSTGPSAFFMPSQSIVSSNYTNATMGFGQGGRGWVSGTTQIGQYGGNGYVIIVEFK